MGKMISTKRNFTLSLCLIVPYSDGFVLAADRLSVARPLMSSDGELNRDLDGQFDKLFPLGKKQALLSTSLLRSIDFRGNEVFNVNTTASAAFKINGQISFDELMNRLASDIGNAVWISRFREDEQILSVCLIEYGTVHAGQIYAPRNRYGKVRIEMGELPPFKVASVHSLGARTALSMVIEGHVDVPVEATSALKRFLSGQTVAEISESSAVGFAARCIHAVSCNQEKLVGHRTVGETVDIAILSSTGLDYRYNKVDAASLVVDIDHTAK